MNGYLSFLPFRVFLEAIPETPSFFVISLFLNILLLKYMFFPWEHHYYGPWRDKSWRWSWEIGGTYGPLTCSDIHLRFSSRQMILFF